VHVGWALSAYYNGCPIGVCVTPTGTLAVNPGMDTTIVDGD